MAKTGSYGYKSQTIADNGKSESIFTITVPGTATNAKLSFDYKVVSENGCDWLTITLDDTIQLVRVSGDTGVWGSITDYALTVGTHTLKLTYTKDLSVSVGLDSGAIDNLQLTYDQLFITSNGLRYQIQYTSNNGASWADLLALSAVNQLNYTYDFTSTLATSAAKIRARAYNGTAYGPWDESNAVFIITHTPNMSSTTVSSITNSAANLSSTIYAKNGSTVASFGHCWGTSSSPTIANSKTTMTGNPADGTAIPSSALGLLDETTYYVRSYATTNTGITTYGAQASFTTLPDPPNTPTLSTMNGTASVPAVSIVTSTPLTWVYTHPDGVAQGSYGIEIKYASDNTVFWSTVRTYAATTTVNKNFTTEVGKLLYWRVQAWDSAGVVSAWSTNGYFITYLPPTVTTTECLLRAGNNVSLTGTINDLGGSLNNEYGFVYGSVTDPTIANTKVVLGTTDQLIVFNHVMKTMAPGTYYFRSYIIASGGTAYGASFQVIVPPVNSKSMVAKLTKEGHLQLSGVISERLPAVQNGLVQHYPLDGNAQGESWKRNLLDTSLWKVGGSGTQGYFGVNGSSSEANVIEYENPWGVKEKTWAVLRNDSTSDADGGWNVTGRPIDNTKKYRLSVWIKRENVGNGTTYFGCQSNSVCNLGTTTVNGNPYFLAGNFSETHNQWVLFVGYIQPHDYATALNEPTNGLYTSSGVRVGGATDYKWAPTATTGGHRTYLYYSTSTEERQYWQRPRFEMCDGTEATITDLLMGRDDAVNPVVNTNTTLTNEHIAVEEATTNVVATPHLFSSGWTHYDNGHDGAFMTEFGVEGLNIINKRSWCGAVKPITLPAVGTYTLTVWVKPIARTSADVQISLYTSGGGIGDTAVYASWAPEQIGKWQRLEMTRTYTTTSFTLYLICFGGVNAAGYEVSAQYTMPQIEQKTFSTSFVSGSRSAGRLELPVKRTEEYTVFGSFIPNTPFNHGSTAYSTTAAGASLIRIEDSVKVGGFYFKYYISGTNSAPYINRYGYYGTGNIHQVYEVVANVPVYFAIRKIGTTVSIKLHQGGWKLEHVATVAIDAGLDRLIFGDGVIWNGRHKNISVYNRSLTDSELDAMVKHTFRIMKNGDLLTDTISSKPVGLPGDAIYIPLHVDSKAYGKDISPSTESNVIYEQGAAWVGAAVTNMYRQATSDSDFQAKGSGLFTVERTGREVIFQYDYSQNLTWTYHGQTIAVVSGTVYRASMDVFISADANIPSTGTTFVANMEGGCATTFYYDNTKKGTWQHFENVVTATTASTNLYLYPTGGTTPATTGHVKYKNVMVTTLSFTPPFVEGTRPYSRLNYTGTTVTNNNWQEFTLTYRVKYSQSGVYRLSGAWSRFYFGVNTGNTLMLSWVDGTQLSVGSSGTIPINKWVTVGVTVKNNVAIDLYVDGNRVGGRGAGFNLSSTSMDFGLNSLSPADSSYPLNAWVKNLIFAPRALTAVEMKTLHQVQMRSTSTELQVANKIIEGTYFE
jgi:hypothetical protein